MLSLTVEYALRASIYIARQAPRHVRVAEIADAVAAPRNYLSKTLGQLVRAGFLDSARGPTGGFRLAPRAGARPLSELVSLLGDASPHRCLLGYGECGTDPDCTAHQRWRPVAESTNAFFANTTLNDLLSHPEARATTPSGEGFHPLLSPSRGIP